MRFVSRVNMTTVNQTNGMVEPRTFPTLGNWNRQTTLDVRQSPSCAFTRTPVACQASTGAFELILCAPALATCQVLLTALRRDMASPVNRRLPQPPEGSIFPGS